MKLSPQKEIIVSVLRDLQWHCGREWVDRIKDDRIRITELNRGYMKKHGFEIVGEPCRGTVCGIPKCPLYKRRAERVDSPVAPKTALQRIQEVKIAHTASQKAPKSQYVGIKPLFAL